MKIKKVIKVLENLVNSASDEGCDGCYTVSAEDMEKAKKLLQKYYEKKQSEG